MRLRGAITFDVDSLDSIFRGRGLRDKSYSYREFSLGFDTILSILKEFNIKATFFVVGQDLVHERNREIIRDVWKEGHEVANHTMRHIQGFRYLSRQEKINELKEAEDIIAEVVGEKPKGFRAPGWNVDDSIMSILKGRDYLYDSSIFPSFLNPLLKCLHYRSTSLRSCVNRTTLGPMKYMFAPTRPYQANEHSFLKKSGDSSIVELPISVTPFFRMPFFATFLLKTGIGVFEASYKLMKTFKRPIIYLFHLFDFVDFSDQEFVGQLPEGNGIYIPDSIRVPLQYKLKLFRKAISIMTEDYDFILLKELASSMLQGSS